MGTIAAAFRDQIIERVARGTKLEDIARELNLGVSRQALSKVLRDDPEYRDARELALESMLDQRESELETAREMVDVARARDLLAQARWRAERECPHRWGPRAQIDMRVDIGSALQQLSERIQGRIIDGAPQQDAQEIGSLPQVIDNKENAI